MAKHQNRPRQPVPASGAAAMPAPQVLTSPPSQPQQQVPPSDRNAVIPLIKTVEKLRDSRVIAYFLDEQASIAFDVSTSFYRQLRLLGKQERIDLWIHSHGGTTEVPWQIVQMIRSHCKVFGVLVTEFAQSAATHIALGADEIVMGPFSWLSPVDPQRRHPLLPKDPDGNQLAISVQDLKHAVEFIKREAGDHGLSGEAYAQVMTALFDKVHPLALGAIEQSYALSKLISRRMLSTHMDEITDGQKIQELADALCDDYKSHQFPIGLMESKRLGLKAVEASDALYNAMWELLDYYQRMDRNPKPLPANARFNGQILQGNATIQSIGHLDSSAVRIDCQAVTQFGRDGKPVGQGAIWEPLPK